MAIRPEPVFLSLNPEFPRKIITLVKNHDIKMVYWDLGGTLVDLSKEMKERAVKRINSTYHKNINVEMYNQAIKREWMRREHPAAMDDIKSVNDDRKEKQYWIEFYTCVLGELGIRVKNRDIVKWLATVQANAKSFEELPYVRETLTALRGLEIPVGIISNAFPSARRILERSGLLSNFEDQHVILSYEYNSIKPEKSIYQKAISRAKVRPHQILFIDDRKSFVDGAAERGMKAVVINDTDDQDLSGPGRSAIGLTEDTIERQFTVIWFSLPLFKGIRNRLARLLTGLLCYQSPSRHTAFLLPRRGM